MGPHPAVASELARETGISQATLSRWKQEAAMIPAMPSKPGPESKAARRAASSEKQSPKRRSGADKLDLVVRAAGLEGEALGAFLRNEGVHLAELEQWREQAQEALSSPGRRSPSKEVRRLEAELARKDKALAETAALIVLKKKVAEIWGAEDDDTTPKSE